MNIEAILWDWQSDEDPIDWDGICPECMGDGKAFEVGDWDCPLCGGTGEYDEAFRSLLDALDAGAIEAYYPESLDVA